MILSSANWQDVPDVVTLPSPGLKKLRVKGEPKVVDRPGKDGRSEKRLQLIFSVEQPSGPDHGKTVFDNPDVETEEGQVSIKRVFKSAGLPVPPEGLDTTLLTGRIVQAILIHRNRTADGVQQTYCNVQKYLIPGDKDYAQDQ
jgi:hypothetical protein